MNRMLILCLLIAMLAFASAYTPKRTCTSECDGKYYKTYAACLREEGTTLEECEQRADAAWCGCVRGCGLFCT